MALDHTDGRRLRKPYSKHRGSVVPLLDHPELAPGHTGAERVLRSTAPARKVTAHDRSTWRVPPVNARRAIDIAVALTALVATLPVLVFACIVMALTMHRKVFFFQQRYGQHGRLFTLVKLRSLKDATGRAASESNAHRLTPVARVIRRFGIDELPQFVNVLRGDMSLFGPRPFDVEPDTEGWKGRYAIKPGLIGLASVREKISGLPSSLEKVTADDLEYISRQTWRLDAWLLIMAAACILTGRIDPQEQQMPGGIVYNALNRVAGAIIG